MTNESTAGDDARNGDDAPPSEKRSGSADSWDPTDPVDLDHLVPLDMANNIDDQRTKQRITWVDGFGRAYADALEDAAPVVTTDGGVESAKDLKYDPRAFGLGMSPAVVEEICKDDVVNKVSFADVQLRESGALYWTEWSGAEGLLPEWRWSEVRYLDTERSERDANKFQASVVPADWDRLPDAVRGLVDQDDDADESELVADGGHRPGHTPGTNAPDWNEVKSSSFTDDGVARFPELVGVDRDILMTLARSAPCNGRELLADLETLRNEKIEDARLYPHLNELADAGLVEKRENFHDNRSHEFRLADAGRHSLREHAQRLEGAVAAFEEGER